METNDTVTAMDDLSKNKRNTFPTGHCLHVALKNVNVNAENTNTCIAPFSPTHADIQRRAAPNGYG
ncbi:hypothetical protein OUZ56_007650 [Daphnia magna]|uniref:Uncharacterized protein n=1 Tax=Daphnia magna TaxID=35525 RepID=A0ABR0AAK5_9CRUS|nr:hypothetical protein OUZ56_007650 [Daphnia magna]